MRLFSLVHRLPILLPILLCVSSAPARSGSDLPAPPTSPNRFVERPGELEFRGVLTARPLQPSDAAKYGLSEAEIAERRVAARAAMSEYPLVQYVSDTDEYLLEVGLGNEQAAADDLMAGGDFQYVHPDWIVYPIANCTSDPLLPSQWHHEANRMNSCAGWGIETGDPSVVIAICDTGLRVTHSDVLLHRQEGYNAVDQVWESQGGKIDDINGHGTATTGCAAANGDNGNGISGTGWNLGHRMMRVSNVSSGSSNLSILTHAARLASDVGDKVASVSYTGAFEATTNTAGAYVRANGALLVWAAGNNAFTLNGDKDDNVIIVGATDSNDVLAGFSNRGSRVDLVAPGVSVYTLNRASDASYSSWSGTSFSCPLTSGLCGLMWAANPSLSPQQVEDFLRAGCDDLGASGIDDLYGYGRIDVFESLSLVPTCGITPYCTAQDNSSGSAGAMGWSGSASLTANDLTLTAGDCPVNQFGLFFLGDAQANVPSGSGTLCVGGSLARFDVVQVDGTGSASLALDQGDLPPSAGPFSPGDQTYFSFWFRDVGSTWNFTDGLCIEWCN